MEEEKRSRNLWRLVCDVRAFAFFSSPRAKEAQQKKLGSSFRAEEYSRRESPSIREQKSYSFREYQLFLLRRRVCACSSPLKQQQQR